MLSFIRVYLLIIGVSVSVLAFSFQYRHSDFRQQADEGKFLTYTSPGALGIDSVALYAGIADIVTQAIDSSAFPGCSILLAKGGEIFYEQTFGYHTYTSLLRVNKTDLYDLASITKVTASTMALMKMYDDGKFDLDQNLGYYFPFLAHSNKSDLSVRKVLAHQSGLQSWIPYYQRSQRKSGEYKNNSIASDSSSKYPYRISDADLYLYKDYQEKKINRMIRKSPLYDKEEYVYSGLSFYLWPELVERTYGKPFDEFLTARFYQPLGANTVCFLPTRRFSLDQIVPTEVDTFFRGQLLHGVVHDEGAAMMRGISGNAGLFGNARDLAKTFQMLLNGGTYAGRRYLSENTIAEFTRCQYCDKDNRRGLGFDKPLIEYDSIKTSVAKKASPASFGHSGYTGTLAWADPQNDLIFIFLTNRVFPSRENKKIYEMNVRPRIHDLVYELLEGTAK